ncbi:hypothetical protein 8F11_31 [uncultured Caudovirales phage]|uniref:Uncharacterized protein n=1 Tax=uncultured Caudovirales phage TaxID=2100421 RepID=A0A2H4J6G5_9CAUD|nr:hypothetical protein 8F11_31 [uncultured Caudovirales phage]
MTKFYFKIEGWHGLNAEQEAERAKLSEEVIEKYIQRVCCELAEMMYERALEEGVAHELNIEYKEVTE